MTMYHINKHGVPAPCKATSGKCPLGGSTGSENHFPDNETAQIYIDNKNQNEFGILPETNKSSEQKLEDYGDKLVPAVGKADTVAGELVRAMGRLLYRFYNDGDKVNSGYGQETCNSSFRYLNMKLSEKDGGETAAYAIEELGEGDNLSDGEYEDRLNDGLDEVVRYLDSNPNLQTEVNEEDSVGGFTRDSDYQVDEEEEYEDDYEDEDDY